MIDAANWRAEQATKLSTITAWHTANLSRAKRLPPLEKLLKPKRRKAETVPEQIAFFKNIAAALNARMAAAAKGKGAA